MRYSNRIRYRSIIDMSGSYIGIIMVLPNGQEKTVAWVAVPVCDGDYRANCELYDSVLEAYKKRISKVFRNHGAQPNTYNKN